MAGDYFYDGADYGFDPEYGGTSQAYSSDFTAAIGISTDPRTANALKAASEKLNTGANIIEISQTSPEVFESIPREHFKELNRLRKVVGDNVELTLHAPVIEPTGMTKRGWDMHEREQAERQMFDAVQKAHDLNPKGNVITTFHSSAIGLPSETVAWEEIKEGGEKKKVEVVKEVLLIDENTGSIENLPLKPSALEGEKKIEVGKSIANINKKAWFDRLQHLNYSSEQGTKIIEDVALQVSPELEQAAIGAKEILGIYKDYSHGNIKKVEKELAAAEETTGTPEARKVLMDKLHDITSGDIYLRDAYVGLRDLFNQAYNTLEKSKDKDEKAKADFDKLESFRKKISPKIEELQDPANVDKFAQTLREGVHVLRSIEVPQTFKPFKEFAIDKSSETFANVAVKAYKEFKENAPIISIENPPAGFTLSRAEDLNKLVKASREKFADKAVKDLGLSEGKAKEEAERLIGATWDVGHINMIRKYGAGSKEVLEETKKIAPMVKHVHLSDNFGMEHTELPMGMGNVPTREMMKEIMKHNEKFKKIAEVGNWYQHFQTTPFAETMQHFNSPIYAMKNATSYLGPQGYFSGYGMNPEIHHAMYGAGFSNLPVELGGQMAGRSRVSGAPIE